MSNEDFQVAHLSEEQMKQLKDFEIQLGVTLIAYEHPNVEGNQHETR